MRKKDSSSYGGVSQYIGQLNLYTFNGYLACFLAGGSTIFTFEKTPFRLLEAHENKHSMEETPQILVSMHV